MGGDRGGREGGKRGRKGRKGKGRRGEGRDGKGGPYYMSRITFQYVPPPVCYTLISKTKFSSDNTNTKKLMLS